MLVRPTPRPRNPDLESKYAVEHLIDEHTFVGAPTKPCLVGTIINYKGTWEVAFGPPGYRGPLSVNLVVQKEGETVRRLTVTSCCVLSDEELLRLKKEGVIFSGRHQCVLKKA